MSFETLIESIVRRVIREELSQMPRADAPSPGLRDEYAPIDRIAQRLDVHPNTLRRAIKCGALQATKAGGVWRIRQTAADEWLAAGGRTRPTQDKVSGDDVAKRVEQALARRRPF
jgi:excisionase family DNA binding protein